MSVKDVLLARQPIFNREIEICGYEILFRNNESNQASVVCDTAATSDVLINLFTESDLSAVTGSSPAFINFSSELLDKIQLFHPESIVVEILETVEISEKLIEQIAELKQKGYTIAIDDVVSIEKYKALMPYVDIVKIDLPLIQRDQLTNLIQAFRQYPVKLLAEKVETHEEFKDCLALGFDLFQGYFLSRPELVRGSKMSPGQMAVLQLLAELRDPDTNVIALSEIISKDTVLSYKLLKMINSAAFRRPREIDSIRTAVALVGIEFVRNWASLIALSKLQNKPEALQYIALVRAMTCEALAKQMDPEHVNQFYTVGLFSCLDAFFDLPLPEVIQNIPIEEPIKEALIEHKGSFGLILHAVKEFEKGNLDDVPWQELEDRGIDCQKFNDTYYECSALALTI